VKPKSVKYHPLLSKEILQKVENAKKGKEPVAAPEKKPEKKKPQFEDPLQMFAGSSDSKVTDDPLLGASSFAAASAEKKSNTATTSSSKTRVESTENPHPDFEPWYDKTPRILAKYTTSKHISVSANFLEENEAEATSNKAVDHVKSRLEQLEIDEATDEGKSMMTQNEYISHMEEQHTRLKTAWEQGERVVSLKIAIQCAKLLGDTSVPQFYPSMYVLLTTVLDTFGDLVFHRIKDRGLEGGGEKLNSLPANFMPTDVCSSAKETCRNWFYKTACIRELMPRLYIDMALIKSYRFLEECDYTKIFSRLSRAIRGIGDPLAATYARAFLATKINCVACCYYENDTIYRTPADPWRKTLLEAFDDFMFTFKAHRAEDFTNISHVGSGKIDANNYIDLYSPALEWMLQNIGYNSNEDLFYALLQQYKDYCNNSAVLVHILASFKPSFISSHALNMTTMIKGADENTAVLKSKLYLTLGKCLISSPPPKNQLLPILNDVWKVVTKITDPDEYIEIAVVFVQYLLINFTEREVNIFLKDVIKHVKKGQAHLRLQEQIQTIISKVMEYTKDIEKTLSMDNFLPVIDLLETANKVPCGKVILSAFASNTKMVSTSDPVIIHTLFDVARSLHDSIDSMTFEDERKQISRLIVSFVRKIDFGRDLEKQLNMYVDCRQSFTSLDAVTSELVIKVTLLATRAHTFMKGKHTRKTAAFVKACLAYCHITIPSLDSYFSRLHLFLQSGEVALVNGMIVQGEAFLKAAISLIPDIPPTREDPMTKLIVKTENEMVGFILNFASSLLLFPGHPSNGPFYLVKGLMKVVDVYPTWKDSASVSKCRVLMGFLSLFCTYYQTTFPAHIDRVESNDALYGGTAEYKAEIFGFIDTLMEQIKTQINELGSKGDLIAKKDQGTTALDFVNLLISSMEMNPHSATLVVKLFQMAKQTAAVDKNYLGSTFANIEGKKGTWYQDVANKIRGIDESAAA